MKLPNLKICLIFDHTTRVQKGVIYEREEGYICVVDENRFFTILAAGKEGLNVRGSKGKGV